MKTRIEIYEIADPNHIVSDGELSRKLSAADIRNHINYMMRPFDPRKYSSRVVYINQKQ